MRITANDINAPLSVVRDTRIRVVSFSQISKSFSGIPCRLKVKWDSCFGESLFLVLQIGVPETIESAGGAE